MEREEEREGGREREERRKSGKIKLEFILIYNKGFCGLFLFFFLVMGNFFEINVIEIML